MPRAGKRRNGLQPATCVNGETAHLGDKADPERDRITVRGRPLNAAQEYVYLMLHKPRGYITTMSDERDRKCVAELIEDVEQRVYPVGRLDKDSEGLPSDDE